MTVLQEAYDVHYRAPEAKRRHESGVSARNATIPILMYHSISQSANPRFRDLCVPPAMFAAQVDYLLQRGYTFLNVTQLVQGLTGQAPLPEQPVVLTFDDGFADFYDWALPVFARYGLTATLYITTGFIGRTALWLRHEGETERPMLSWRQVIEISNSGVECGAHTHSHPQLDTLPPVAARDEIVRSKDVLEQHLGCEVTSFAYPFGYYTAHVRWLVREAGFSSACAVNFAMCRPETADPFALERVMVTPAMDIGAFGALLAQDTASSLRKLYVRARIPVKQTLRYCAASLARLSREVQGGRYEGGLV